MAADNLGEHGNYLPRAFMGGEHVQDFHCGVPRPRMNWETKEGIGFSERIIGDGQPGRNAHRDEFSLVRKVEERDG
jgi:hypothetical protein